MSFWGNIGDRFQQGYAMGERMRENRLRREESEAYTNWEKEDAQQAIPVESPDYQAGYEQVQTRGTPDIATADLSQGVSQRMGGAMADNGMAVNPEGRMGSRFQIDPEVHDRKRAARSKAIQATMARDPTRGLMMKKYFQEQDRQDVLDAIKTAMVAQESGDMREFSHAALHAYNLIDDGNNAQLRMVNGHPVGVSFDKKSGEMKGMMSLDSGSLMEMYAILSDPFKHRQMLREDKQDVMAAEAHDLQQRAGEATLEQANWTKLHREDMYNLNKRVLEGRAAVLGHQGEYYKSLAEYTATRGVGGSGGLSGEWGSTPKDAMNNFNKAKTQLDAVIKQQVESTSDLDPKSSKYVVMHDPAMQLSVRSIAEDAMAQYGPVSVPPARALAAAQQLKELEYEINTMPQDAADNRLREAVKTVQVKDGRLLVKVDGMMIPLDTRYAVGLAEALKKVADQKPDDPHAAEVSKTIAQQLGEGIGNAARALTHVGSGAERGPYAAGIPTDAPTRPGSPYAPDRLDINLPGQETLTDLFEGIDTGFDEGE